jgi:hypothetical protein
MRTGQGETAAVLNPRSHFLVILSAENLAKRPLDIPIFHIIDGRRGRSIDCRSAEGMRILLDGRNVLYTGATIMLGARTQNVGLRDVLEGLRANLMAPAGDSDGLLRAGIEAHIAELVGYVSSKSLPGAAA